MRCQAAAAAETLPDWHIHGSDGDGEAFLAAGSAALRFRWFSGRDIAGHQWLDRFPVVHLPYRYRVKRLMPGVRARQRYLPIF